MNGNIQLKCSNYVAFSHFHGEAVNNIGLISGSDCHTLEQVGFGGIKIKENVSDIKELVQILKQQEVEILIKGENDDGI